MKHVDLAGIRSEPGKRFQFLCDFVGFTNADWEALRESVPVLAPKLPGFLDALYDHLLSYDDARRIFLGTSGEVDPAYMTIRKEHLTEWFLETAGAVGQHQAFAGYVTGVGRAHTGLAGDPGRVVPPRYIVALTSFIQTALTSAIFDALPNELARARRFALAWNKMLILQLELFLKEIAPCWPHWDEAPGAS